MIVSPKQNVRWIFLEIIMFRVNIRYAVNFFVISRVALHLILFPSKIIRRGRYNLRLHCIYLQNRRHHMNICLFSCGDFLIPICIRNNHNSHRTLILVSALTMFSPWIAHPYLKRLSPEIFLWISKTEQNNTTLLSGTILVKYTQYFLCFDRNLLESLKSVRWSTCKIQLNFIDLFSRQSTRVEIERLSVLFIRKQWPPEP